LAELAANFVAPTVAVRKGARCRMAEEMATTMMARARC